MDEQLTGPGGDDYWVRFIGHARVALDHREYDESDPGNSRDNAGHVGKPFTPSDDPFEREQHGDHRPEPQS